MYILELQYWLILTHHAKPNGTHRLLTDARMRCSAGSHSRCHDGVYDFDLVNKKCDELRFLILSLDREFAGMRIMSFFDRRGLQPPLI